MRNLDSKKLPESREDRDYRERLPGLKVDISLRRVLSTRDGRAVIRWLIVETGLERGSFNTNALTMAFSEGRRSVGVALFDRIKRVDPESLKLMQDEADE